MANTGAPWNIPYVEPTDLVRDYPAADEAMAEAVAAGLTLAGGLVAVKSFTLATTQSMSIAEAGVEDTNLEVTITPSSASNKIIVTGHIHVSVGLASRQNSGAVRFVRDATLVGAGTPVGVRTAVTSTSVGAENSTNGVVALPFAFVDTPSTTSAVVYKAQLVNAIGAASTLTFHVNRSQGDADVTRTPAPQSTIVAMEVRP